VWYGWYGLVSDLGYVWYEVVVVWIGTGETRTGLLLISVWRGIDITTC